MKPVQEFRISDALLERISLLLPVHVPKPHPLGCHRLRIEDQDVLDVLFLFYARAVNGKTWT